MTVVHDQSSESSIWTTTPDPFTFTHTPIGTPAGVVVFIAQTAGSGDTVSGVTYGGVTMARIQRALDNNSELSSCYLYFLGSSIPSGAQTVSIDHNAGAEEKIATCVTVTAGADTQMVVSGKVDGNAANPSVALNTGATEALRYAALVSGHNALSSLTNFTGTTTVQQQSGLNTGLQITRSTREDAASTGSFTMGWTATSEDCSMVAGAIEEVVAAAAENPYPYIGGGYYPTEG